MPQRDIIVEFIGVPGAGKSTLAAALAEKLSTKFDVARPQFSYPRKELTSLEKVRLDVMYAPSFLIYRLRRVFFDVKNFGLGFWVVVNGWEQSRYPVYILDKARVAPKRFYILHEWLMHRIVGESIARYASNVSFSMKFAIPTLRTHRLVYVCVRVDRALGLERILNQDQPFRKFAKTKDRGIIEEVLGLWDRQLEQLKSEIQRRQLVCIDVDGTAPIEANVELLLKQLVSVSENCQRTQS